MKTEEKAFEYLWYISYSNPRVDELKRAALKYAEACGYRFPEFSDPYDQLKQAKRELVEALEDLALWGSAWLPDEAKDSGARESLRKARAVLARWRKP